jgi:hypothetical protein
MVQSEHELVHVTSISQELGASHQPALLGAKKTPGNKPSAAVVSCLRACSLKSVKLQFANDDLCIGDSVAATVMAAGAAIAEDILFRGDFEFLKFENNLHMFHLLSGLFTLENL